LRGFQQRLTDFHARDIHVVAISVDPPEINRRHTQKLGFTFTFLSDPDAQVIRAYDLLHRGAGPKGTDVARPGEFLIDSNGIVRWLNLTESVTVRARPEEVLKAADELFPVLFAGQR
jgi:peroxiredoxin